MVLGFRPDEQTTAEKRLFQCGISRIDVLKGRSREQVFFIRLLQKIPRVRAWWYGSIDLDEL